MKYIKYWMLTAFCGAAVLVACNNDDNVDDGFIPARDRAEEAPLSQAIVKEYLETHFYNYEDFANPPANFDFQIRFDTIAGNNADKTPLIEQVVTKRVQDRIKEDLFYDLYYLNVIQGEGESPDFADVVTISYDGIYINREEENRPYSQRFDASTLPVRFDMTGIVNGLQDAISEFNTATDIVTNPDGSLSFIDYGVGAVFMPSGLGYYVNPPPTSAIPLYSQLIFTFQLYAKETGDQDNDGVVSTIEDLNMNMIEEDDDTDGDLIPNYNDPDDDGDGRPTRDEIEIDADGNVTFPDSDGDGLPDYLDPDN
jgi:hypothetical protein